MVVLKLQGNDGSLIWGRRVGSSSYDYGKNLIVSDLDEPIITGYTLGSWFESQVGKGDMFVIRLDKNNGSTVQGYQGFILIIWLNLINFNIEGSSYRDQNNGLASSSTGKIITGGYTFIL